MMLNGKSARLVPQSIEPARSDAAGPQEDVSLLLRQIGSPDYFDFFGIASNAPSTNGFLDWYVTELLVPVELPAIAEACGHALRQEHRELVSQDQALARQIELSPTASASRRIGRLQLARLRPLRDERILRRYAAAVEDGKAEGWHTLVYGITMALFSMPLREGLLHYSSETLRVLERNVCGTGDAPQMAPLMERIPPAVEAALLRC